MKARLAWFAICIYWCIVSTRAKSACAKLDPNKLNVHLIPHSHENVGWLKTVDQYYYGSNKIQQNFGAQYVFRSVVLELHENADRRFVFVEIAFFSRWWSEQNDEIKNIVKDLVSQGRLEFALGGWCTSDEATTHYSANIDQMTLGLKFLNDTFGDAARPTAAWQIDTFGHSSSLADDFVQMGFDGVFFGRIDYEDQRKRNMRREAELIWKPFSSLGNTNGLFSSIMYNRYSSPNGFCFDPSCVDEPIMDNAMLHGYNVDLKIRRFEDHMFRYNATYKTNNVLVTMGGGFAYEEAQSWFINMDKLIKYSKNMTTTLNVIYSTPSCYLKALYESNQTWPSKEDDDFFPYQTSEASYWTGYYTSRSPLKRNIYWANGCLQGVKQMATMLGDDYQTAEYKFKTALAICQHNNAVAGTEAQHVADDYSQYLFEGLKEGGKIILQAYKTAYGLGYVNSIDYCLMANISQCNTTENSAAFTITIYNQLSRKLPIYFVSFPAASGFTYQIYRQDGSTVKQELMPIPNEIRNVTGRQSRADFDAIFAAYNIPPLGGVNYYVTATQGVRYQSKARLVKDPYVLSNGIVTLTFDRTTGLLTSYAKYGTTWTLRQNFYRYDPSTSTDGAYLFTPKTQDPPQPISQNATISQYRSMSVMEVRQQFNSWLSQRIRLYKNSEDIEFRYLVNPLPIIENNGTDLVIKYSTDINSNGVFDTDSNGRRWVSRTRNYRKYFNSSSISEQNISSNYYPITTAVRIRDQVKQLTIITDRPQGASSLNNGEIEVMIQRRSLYDDNLGLLQALDEISYGLGVAVAGIHVLQLNNLSNANSSHRFKVEETVYPPIITYSSANYSLQEWTSKYNKSFTLIVGELPANVRILTLERWRADEILLRLEHIFDYGEHANYSVPVTVDITKLLLLIKIKSFREVTLGANLDKNKLNRLKFSTQNGAVVDDNKSSSTDGKIELKPMQIKTFVLRIDDGMLEQVRDNVKSGVSPSLTHQRGSWWSSWNNWWNWFGRVYWWH